MTDLQDYDSFEDAADCILGAAKDLAAAEVAFDDKIPAAQEVDDDDASLYLTETEASATPLWKRWLADSLYNDIDHLGKLF